jgi:hypothetical protein
MEAIGYSVTSLTMYQRALCDAPEDYSLDTNVTISNHTYVKIRFLLFKIFSKVFGHDEILSH